MADYARPSTTVEGAAADVDQAEAALSAAIGDHGLKNRVDAPSEPSSQPPQPAPAPPGLTPQKPQAAESGSDDENHCRNVCEALSSMVRAVHHLCELTGDDDGRCTEAKGRAERAEQRVSQSCPACSHS